MDVLTLFAEQGQPLTVEGHKHCRPGWGNIACPFCTGNPGLHLGFTLDGSYCYCWRCGWKPLSVAIAAILHIPEYKASELLKEYGGRSVAILTPKTVHEFSLPTNMSSLSNAHKAYLSERNFDPVDIEQRWKIASLGPTSILKTEDAAISYKNRILIPIFWEDQMVSFQTRTTTKDVILRYIACPKNREIIGHQSILYGNPYGWTDTGICLEGVTDVWRFGVRACATFGIEFTHKQVRHMAKHFRRVVIIFDNEIQAQIQANKLANELKVRGISVGIEVVNAADPASLTQAEADYIVKNIK